MYCWLGKAAVDRINGAAIDFTSVVGPAKRPVHDGERRGAYDTSEWRALTATEHDTETWQGLQALSDNHGGNGRAFTATGHTLRPDMGSTFSVTNTDGMFELSSATQRNPETRHVLQTLSNKHGRNVRAFHSKRARTETPWAPTSQTVGRKVRALTAMNTNTEVRHELQILSNAVGRIASAHCPFR